MMRLLGILALLIAIIWFALPVSGGGAPNIIYIMVDDLGYGDVTAYNPDGGTHTPNLDMLVRGGAKFTQYRATAPLCSPTRVSFLTGEHPTRLNIRTVPDTGSGSELPPPYNWGIEPEIEALPETLNGLGYRTVHIGKWHVGNAGFAEYNPLGVGFDRGELAIVTGSYSSAFLRVYDPVTGVNTISMADGVYIPEMITNRALAHINQAASSGEPLFLNLWYIAPHIMGGQTGTSLYYDTPDKWLVPFVDAQYVSQVEGEYVIDEEARENIAEADRYAALVNFFDYQVGRILTSLTNNDMLDDTIIIFASDNGPIGHPERFATDFSNAGLQGYKLDLTDGGVRVPLVVYWQGVVPQSVLGVELVTEDIAATIVDFAGGALWGDGLSFADVILGGYEDSYRYLKRSHFWEVKEWTRLAEPDQADWVYNFAVLENGYKLVGDVDHEIVGGFGLYDVMADAGEMIDLDAVEPLLAQYREQYREWYLVEHRIPYSLSGTVGVSDYRLNVRRGDLSVSVAVSLPVALIGQDVDLIEYPGAWKVSINQDGQIVLWVRWSDETDDEFLSYWYEPIEYGFEQRVTFVVDSYRQDRTGVGMYINETLVGDGLGPAVQRAYGVFDSRGAYNFAVSEWVTDVDLYGRVLEASDMVYLDTDVEVALDAPPVDVNLIYNANFLFGLNGMAGWDLSGDLLTQVSGAYPLPSDSRMVARMQITNPTASTQTVRLIARNATLTNTYYCDFEVPPESSGWYGMEFRTLADWEAVRVDVRMMDEPVLVDAVRLVYQPWLTVGGKKCLL